MITFSLLQEASKVKPDKTKFTGLSKVRIICSFFFFFYLYKLFDLEPPKGKINTYRWLQNINLHFKPRENKGAPSTLYCYIVAMKITADKPVE